MADKYEGFVKLYRTIRKHWLWEDKPFSKGQAWLDLLLLANHCDHKSVSGGVVTVYHRGQVNVSQRYLAEAWGWSRKKVKAFIADLVADEMLKEEPRKEPPHNTALTIVNYTFWQGALFEKEPQKEPPRNHQGATKEPPRNTNNNYIEYIYKDNNDNYLFKSPRAEAMKKHLEAIREGRAPKRGNL